MKEVNIIKERGKINHKVPQSGDSIIEDILENVFSINLHFVTIKDEMTLGRKIRTCYNCGEM